MIDRFGQLIFLLLFSFIHKVVVHFFYLGQNRCQNIQCTQISKTLYSESRLTIHEGWKRVKLPGDPAALVP